MQKIQHKNMIEKTTQKIKQKIQHKKYNTKIQHEKYNIKTQHKKYHKNKTHNFLQHA